MITRYGDLVCNGEFASLSEFARHIFYRGFIGTINTDPVRIRKEIEADHAELQTWNQDHLEKTVARLAEVEARTDQSLMDEIARDQDYYEKERSEYAGLVARNKARQVPLKEMYRKVQAWAVPKELLDLKDYMIDAVEVDDPPSYEDNRQTVAKYRAYLIKGAKNAIKDAKSDIVAGKDHMENGLRIFDAFEEAMKKLEQEES